MYREPFNLVQHSKKFEDIYQNFTLLYLKLTTSIYRTLYSQMQKFNSNLKNFVITCFQTFYIGVHNFAISKFYKLNQELCTKKKSMVLIQNFIHGYLKTII